jgi:hypothetical protein
MPRSSVPTIYALCIALGTICLAVNAKQPPLTEAQKQGTVCPFTEAELSKALGEKAVIKDKIDRLEPSTKTVFRSCTYNTPKLSVTVRQSFMEGLNPADMQKMMRPMVPKGGSYDVIAGDADGAAWLIEKSTYARFQYSRNYWGVEITLLGADLSSTYAAAVSAARPAVEKLRRLP